MAGQGSPSYADHMGGSTHEEQIALIALLQARPDGLSWAEITTEVLASGSAQEVWQQCVSPTLMPCPKEADPLEAAARDIKLWRAGLDAGHDPIFAPVSCPPRKLDSLATRRHPQVTPRS